MALFVWDNSTKKMSVTLAQQLQATDLEVNIIGTSETITGPVISNPISTRYQTIADLSYRPNIVLLSMDGTRNLNVGNAKTAPVQYLETRTRGIYKSFTLYHTFVNLIPTIPAISLTATINKDTTLRTLTLTDIYGSVEPSDSPASRTLSPISFREVTIGSTLSLPTMKGIYGSIEAPTVAVSQDFKPISFKDESIQTILNRPTIKDKYGSIDAPTIAVSQDLKISKIYQPINYKLLRFDYSSLDIRGIDYFDIDKFVPVVRPIYKFIKGSYQHLYNRPVEYLGAGLEQLYVANKKLTRNPQKDVRGQLGLKTSFTWDQGSLTYYFTYSLRDDRTVLNDHEVKQQFNTFNVKKIIYRPGWVTTISPTNVNAGFREIQVLTNPIVYNQKWK